MALPHVVHRFGTKGSTVTVTLQAGGNATMFSDAAGTVPLANPITVSANGYVDFYVAAGTYVLTESGNGTDKRTITVSPAAASDILEGALSARPAASAGTTWYLATDINGGTLYLSDGTTWTQVTAGTLPVGTVIASASLTAASAVAVSAFTDVPGLSMTVPVGIPFRVGMQWKPSMMQGTSAAASAPAIQIRAVNSAATVTYWFDTVQTTFAGASGGKFIGQGIRSLGPAQAALGAALVVKAQAFVGPITGLGAVALDNAFGNFTTELFAVAV